MPRRVYRRKFPRRKLKRRVSRSVKKYVAKKLDQQIEDKFYVVPMATALTPAAAWDYYDFTAQITQGDDVSNRTARKIKIKSLTINGVLQSQLETSGSLRLVIFTTYDQSATPLSTVTFSELIQKNDQGLSQLSRKYYDKYIVFNPILSATSYNSRVVRYYKRFRKPIYVTYATSAETSISRRLVMAILTDSASPADLTFTAGYAKITFEDA